MTLTPPFQPLSKVPFPRPPARTWALITMSSPPVISQYQVQVLLSIQRNTPIFLATTSASAADRATSPLGTPMPYYWSLVRLVEREVVNHTVFNKFADRYSWIERKRFCSKIEFLPGASSCQRLTIELSQQSVRHKPLQLLERRQMADYELSWTFRLSLS